MNGPDTPQEINIRLRWSDTENHPVSFANAFMVQHHLEHRMFFLTLGSAPPLLISPFLQSDPSERAARIEEGIKVQPVAKVSLSPSSMRELIHHLTTNYANYENAIKSPDSDDTVRD